MYRPSVVFMVGYIEMVRVYIGNILVDYVHVHHREICCEDGTCVYVWGYVRSCDPII